MNKDEILRLALEAGLPDVMEFYVGYERLAKLIVANTNPKSFMSWQDGYKAGAAVERETIAQLFDSLPELVPFGKNDQGGCIMCGFNKSFAVEAIRARSNHDQL